ncbi:hypothetical protein BDZ94DRAFT_1204156 [Collybia nuda]|uniref:MI domain-containing protein n=1 Tax=Collybia nuda TaxID=64659 RepID=A0A9P5XTL3_9AGAR|nr:hypothetical protein BDZ94DRAFT_1204156 [Collybia nuda]
MSLRKRTSTTRLPQPLREELSDSIGNYHSVKKKQAQATRKEVRKQDRAVRKRSKAEFFSTRYKRPAEVDHEEAPHHKKPKRDKPQASVTSDSLLPRVPNISKVDVNSQKSLRIPGSKSVTASLDKLSKSSDMVWVPAVKTRKEQEEDSYIAYLESKLGYTKRNKKKITEDDGLDDFLDLASSPTHQTQQAYDLEILNSSEYDEIRDSEGGMFEEWSGIDKQVGCDEEGGVLWDSNTDPNESANAYIAAPSEQPEDHVHYTPPRFQHVQQENQDVIQLTRRLKGLLNRLSEQSMGGVLDSIEDIYRTYKRNDVTSTLTKLIIDGMASHSSLLDSYVVMYAAFVASLHRIIGTEFAAYFVQNSVSLYEQLYANISTNKSGLVSKPERGNGGIGGKEPANLIVLLSELYNFQVISSVLVFDLIRGLLTGGLNEFDVELLLKIVRNSGQQLRQDDPSALKDIVQVVQDKANEIEDLSSRTRFMIETLINLKNNKLKRNTTQNQGGEAVERMKKFLAGLAKRRHLLAHEPLRVSLVDLRSAETRGKWWLVGAAWSGDPLVDYRGTTQVQQAPDEISDRNLLELARKQGMNTDIRRSIFVVLMSSDDYVDACERLSQLTLNEVQQREIVRVILHCCGNEKSYNPYYALVCQHLCRGSHSYKITLQFCLWDFLRDLGETSVGGAQVLISQQSEDNSLAPKNISNTRIRNVAKAYAWWIAKDCVTLTILKPVDFTTLKPQSQNFLRELLVQIFIDSQVVTPLLISNSKLLPTTRNRKAVEQVFIKATRIRHLAMGLVYFMSEVFRDLSEDEEGITKLIKWANGVGKDTLRTGVDVVPNL